jgi:hypothetical protein
MTKPSERQTQAAEARLFEDLPLPSAEQVQQAQAREAAKRRDESPRLFEPNRRQIEMRASDLESLLGADHRARLVWGYVVRQDLSKLFDSVKARGSNAGRAAINPRILFALWLYATLQGVGSGREVARLSQAQDAHRVDLRRRVGELPRAQGLSWRQRSADGRTAHRQRCRTGSSRCNQPAARSAGRHACACRCCLIPAPGQPTAAPE